MELIYKKKNILYVCVYISFSTDLWMPLPGVNMIILRSLSGFFHMFLLLGNDCAFI